MHKDEELKRESTLRKLENGGAGSSAVGDAVQIFGSVVVAYATGNPALLVGSVRPLGRLLSKVVTSPNRRLGDCLVAYKRLNDERLLDEFAQRVRKLEESQEGENNTRLHEHMAATISAWASAEQRCADDKKSRLLLAALLNAFDPDAYEAGLTVTLLELLEKLDYGEIYLLRRFAERSESHLDELFRNGLLAREHLIRLHDARLVHWHGSDQKPLAAFEESDFQSAAPTQLGYRLLALVKGGYADEASS